MGKDRRGPAAPRGPPAHCRNVVKGRTSIVKKKEFIRRIAEVAGTGREEARRAAEAVFSTIAEALKQDGRIVLTGFGTFSITDRKERAWKNPLTGNVYHVQAKRFPKFRPADRLKETVVGK